MPDPELIPIALHKSFRQFNSGEVAGFDEKTARYLVDNDFGIAKRFDKTTGKLVDRALDPPAAPAANLSDKADDKGEKKSAAKSTGK